MKRLFLILVLLVLSGCASVQKPAPGGHNHLGPDVPDKSATPGVVVTIQPTEILEVHLGTDGSLLYSYPPPPVHGGLPVSDPSTWPVPQPGINTVLLDPPNPPYPPLPNAADPYNWEADGAFRIVCNTSRLAFDDPVLAHGKPGTFHLHDFFGNTAVDAYSTVDNLRTNGGNATCRGGTINLTAYWVPAMLDTGNGNVPKMARLLGYYKTGNCSYASQCGGTTAGYTNQPTNIKPVPHGLIMIAGYSSNSDPSTSIATFSCLPPGAANARPGTSGPSIPTCLPGEALWEQFSFPECWDGVNTDSADHRSHMAYAYGGDFTAGKQWYCPADHPVFIPKISYIVMWDVGPNDDTSKWRLSSDVYTGPGGYSAHGDYMYGWDPAVADAWMNACLAFRRDCGSASIATGQTTKEFQGN